MNIFIDSHFAEFSTVVRTEYHSLCCGIIRLYGLHGTPILAIRCTFIHLDVVRLLFGQRMQQMEHICRPLFQFNDCLRVIEHSCDLPHDFQSNDNLSRFYQSLLQTFVPLANLQRVAKDHNIGQNEKAREKKQRQNDRDPTN